jgi:hypothetical protein
MVLQQPRAKVSQSFCATHFLRPPRLAASRYFERRLLAHRVDIGMSHLLLGDGGSLIGMQAFDDLQAISLAHDEGAERGGVLATMRASFSLAARACASCAFTVASSSSSLPVARIHISVDSTSRRRACGCGFGPGLCVAEGRWRM